jgi:probable rRNA maturation factor
MSMEFCLQNASKERDIPSESQILPWLELALEGLESPVVTIRIVDEAESASLNRQYRSKSGPTNVLSFPAELPDEVDLALLGDIVICAPLVRQEAMEQAKPLMAHWAHLVIHGILHLRGYDHLDPEAAEEMESLETRLLHELGFPDPYE